MPSNPYSFNLHGPRGYRAVDIQAVLEEVTGVKPKINLIQPDKLPEFFGQHVPEQYATELAEMTIACLPGGLIAPEMEKEDGAVRGSIELVGVLRKAAAGEKRERSGAL